MPPVAGASRSAKSGRSCQVLLESQSSISRVARIRRFPNHATAVLLLAFDKAKLRVYYPKKRAAGGTKCELFWGISACSVGSA
jgi:hypothetical protein